MSNAGEGGVKLRARTGRSVRRVASVRVSA